MRTTHRSFVGRAEALPLPDASVHLVVTSPPYPMIQMWDEGFSAGDPAVAAALAAADGPAAFEAMHRQLDGAWAECARVLVPGGWLAVNIGDATRSLGGTFALYPNHARIVTSALRLGLTAMPDILWRKPTNAPNKFMGSGMLPGGAYVTYEHEYVALFRKGGGRTFPGEAAARRRESAIFWEERNAWFSDLWEGLPGERQRRTGARERSAAFPLELPWRLIQMYSLLGDVVLDPFAGTGTTHTAAVATGRSSVGVEREPGLAGAAADAVAEGVRVGPARVAERVAAHRRFVAAREAAGKPPRHRSARYGWPVVTGQEVDVRLWAPATSERTDAGWEVVHHEG